MTLHTPNTPNPTVASSVAPPAKPSPTAAPTIVTGAATPIVTPQFAPAPPATTTPAPAPTVTKPTPPPPDLTAPPVPQVPGHKAGLVAPVLPEPEAPIDILDSEVLSREHKIMQLLRDRFFSIKELKDAMFSHEAICLKCGWHTMQHSVAAADSLLMSHLQQHWRDVAASVK